MEIRDSVLKFPDKEHIKKSNFIWSRSPSAEQVPAAVRTMQGGGSLYALWK
jgi:hypothetical protein